MSTTSPDLGRRRPGLNTDTLALGAVFIAMFSFIAAVFAVGLAARAVDEHRNSPAAAGAAVSASDGVEVTLADFRIDPEPLELGTGSVLRVTNAGGVVHNLSVDGKSVAHGRSRREHRAGPVDACGGDLQDAVRCSWTRRGRYAGHGHDRLSSATL